MAGNNVFIGYWKQVTITTTLVVGKKNLNWPSGCPAMPGDNATIFLEGKILLNRQGQIQRQTGSFFLTLFLFVIKPSPARHLPVMPSI